jgi:hypothetical protein
VLGGPSQVDLVAVAVGEASFGRTGAHEQLAAAYGYDVTTDPAWPLLREARVPAHALTGRLPVTQTTDSM